jgi:hypothetical protein
MEIVGYAALSFGTCHRHPFRHRTQTLPAV